MIPWIVGIVAIVTLAAVLYLLDKEIYFYDATHLGPRIQGWFYDRWAEKYDLEKGESQARDSEMLAAPALYAIKDAAAPLILDLASGTGRFPLALLKDPRFTGHIIALDISTGMLEKAVVKLKPYSGSVTFLRWVGYPLPFPDNSFDLVGCVEAFEVMPDIETPLSELYRVLRPGGLLVTTRGAETSGREAKIQSVEQFTYFLQKKGFEQVEITPWWKWFDQALARKPGQFVPGGHTFADTFSCPKCQSVGMKRSASALVCPSCGKKIPIDVKGIILG